MSNSLLQKFGTLASYFGTGLATVGVLSEHSIKSIYKFSEDCSQYVSEVFTDNLAAEYTTTAAAAIIAISTTAALATRNLSTLKSLSILASATAVTCVASPMLAPIAITSFSLAATSLFATKLTPQSTNKAVIAALCTSGFMLTAQPYAATAACLAAASCIVSTKLSKYSEAKRLILVGATTLSAHILFKQMSPSNISILSFAASSIALAVATRKLSAMKKVALAFAASAMVAVVMPDLTQNLGSTVALPIAAMLAATITNRNSVFLNTIATACATAMSIFASPAIATTAIASICASSIANLAYEALSRSDGSSSASTITGAALSYLKLYMGIGTLICLGYDAIPAAIVALGSVSIITSIANKASKKQTTNTPTTKANVLSNFGNALNVISASLGIAAHLGNTLCGPLAVVALQAASATNLASLIFGNPNRHTNKQTKGEIFSLSLKGLCGFIGVISTSLYSESITPITAIAISASALLTSIAIKITEINNRTSLTDISSNFEQLINYFNKNVKKCISYNVKQESFKYTNADLLKDIKRHLQDLERYNKRLIHSTHSFAHKLELLDYLIYTCNELHLLMLKNGNETRDASFDEQQTIEFKNNMNQLAATIALFERKAKQSKQLLNSYMLNNSIDFEHSSFSLLDFPEQKTRNKTRITYKSVYPTGLASRQHKLVCTPGRNPIRRSMSQRSYTHTVPKLKHANFNQLEEFCRYIANKHVTGEALTPETTLDHKKAKAKTAKERERLSKIRDVERMNKLVVEACPWMKSIPQMYKSIKKQVLLRPRNAVKTTPIKYKTKLYYSDTFA